MAKIPFYSQQVTAPRDTPNLVDPSAIEGAGATMRGVAQSTGEIANVALELERQHRDALETTAVNEAIISNKRAKMQAVDQARQQNISNPVGFANGYEDQLKAIDDEMVQKLPSERAKQAFKLGAMRTNAELYGENLHWENTRKVEMYGQSVENATLDLGIMAARAGREGQGIGDLLKDADATTVAGSTFMAPEKVQDLNRKSRALITENWLKGMAESNPAKAEAVMNSKEFDHELGGEGVQKMYDLIDREKKNRLTDYMFQQSVREKQLKIKQEGLMNSYLDKALQGTLTTKDIMDDRILDESQREHMLSMMDKVANKGERTDPATFLDLFKRIHAPDGDPKKITNTEDLTTYVGNGLGFADLQKLRGELAGKGQPESDMKTKFFALGYKAIADKGALGVPDPDAEKLYYDWYNYANKLIDEKTKQGVSMHDLLDPASKEYIGGTIDNYKRGLTDRIKATADQMRAAQKGKPLPPDLLRKEGESVADYLKRTGK